VSLRKKRMICPRLPRLSATCHCQTGARCHDQRVRQMSILIIAMYPLKSTVEISFGSPDSGKIKSQTSSSSTGFYPELRIWQRVAPGSMANIPPGLWAPGKSNSNLAFSPSLSSGTLDLASCVHLNRTAKTYSGPSGFGCFGSSRLRALRDFRRFRTSST
jgi:hypothetical protein